MEIELYGATIINYVVKIWLPIGEYQEYDSKHSQSLRYYRRSDFRLYYVGSIVLYRLMSVLERKRDVYIPYESSKYIKQSFLPSISTKLLALLLLFDKNTHFSMKLLRM